ncbi:MAG: rod shape-determining protein MreC, partial [Woeseiaceae bacterium]
MLRSQSYRSRLARIPALGLRALALVSLSILLMVLDHRDNHLDAVRRAISATVYPLQIVVAAPTRFWVWMRDAGATRNELRLQNSRLKVERLLTNARLQRFTALEAENDRLRELLEARRQVRGEVRIAEIIAVDANPYRHNLVIAIGQQDGVYDGQAIVDVNGVVGQIVEVGLMTAQAILISDPDHALPVEVNRNGLRT